MSSLSAIDHRQSVGDVATSGSNRPFTDEPHPGLAALAGLIRLSGGSLSPTALALAARALPAGPLCPAALAAVAARAGLPVRLRRVRRKRLASTKLPALAEMRDADAVLIGRADAERVLVF